MASVADFAQPVEFVGPGQRLGQGLEERPREHLVPGVAQAEANAKPCSSRLMAMKWGSEHLLWNGADGVA
jgi:hypothetical protein